MVRLLCIAALLAPLPAPLPAAGLTVQELLQKTSAKYQSIDSFVIQVSVVENRAPERSWMKKMTIASAPGGRFRYDIEFFNAGASGIHWYSDGETTWVYDQPSRRYWQPRQAPRDISGVPLFDKLAFDYFTKFRSLAQVRDAEIVKHSEVAASSGSVLCSVVKIHSAKGDPTPWSEVLWIDEARDLVMRSERYEEVSAGNFWHPAYYTTDWVYRQISGPLDASLFTFVAPPDAKRIVKARPTPLHP